jgi:hypothetical protein
MTPPTQTSSCTCAASDVKPPHARDLASEIADERAAARDGRPMSQMTADDEASVYREALAAIVAGRHLWATYTDDPLQALAGCLVIAREALNRGYELRLAARAQIQAAEQTSNGMRAVRVDLAGSNRSMLDRSAVVHGDWPADWTDEELRERAAEHYDVPVRQAQIVARDFEEPDCA